MSDLKGIVINMIILGIFVFSLMSYIIILQEDSGMSEENMIINNSLINDAYGDLSQNLNQQNKAEDSLNSLEDLPPSDYVGDLDVASTVSATRTARSIIIGLWNIYVKLPMVLFGVSEIIASAITTILLILLAIGIWAIWKGAIS